MKNKIRIAPKATKGRGNRWRKGESSNCNASTRKFRQKVNLMTPLSKTSCDSSEFETLRLDQLDLHASSSSLGDNDKIETKSTSMDVDQESIGSCNTFASIYTNCTNVSFSKLMEQWNPSSLLHREMIAILATVTETIKEKGGSESETEYFAVLITLLETTEKEETLAAIAYLLSMVIKKLPEPVKKLKFFEISSLLAEKIMKNQEKTNGYYVISLIRCLCELIKSQELHVMKSSSTTKVYEALLALSLDTKPKIRKAAHRAIVSILKASKIVYENTEHHPLAPKTAEFCIERVNATSTDNINDALHMVNLIKDIITILPAKSVENCCKTSLRVMYLGNPLLIHGSFSVFLQLFSSSSPLRELTPQLNIELLRRLEDKCPSYEDSQLLSSWITVMKEGYISLYSLDKRSCLGMILSFFNKTISCFQSDSKIVHLTATTALQQMIQSIVSPSLSELDRTVLANITDVFEKSLSFKYQNAWGSICSIIGTFMENIGKQAPDLIYRFIRVLIDLREGFNTKFLGRIDEAISKAIKSLGPEVILNVVWPQGMPIGKDLLDNNQFAHSWLLPLLRDSIEKTELRVFRSFFIPLSKEIEKQINTMDRVKQSTKIKLFETLYNQIWSLLPSFCKQPTDIQTSFTEEFARFLGRTIKSKTNIRNFCLSALRNLIMTAASDEDKAVISVFAAKYLPIFFEIYINPENCATGSKDVLPVYETLRVYLTITDAPTRAKNLKKILEKLQSFDGDVKLRNYLLDLLLLFIPYLESADYVGSIYKEIIMPVIHNPDDNISLKKIYRLIQEICCSVYCKEFISSLNVDIISMLRELIKQSPDKIKYLLLNSIDILCSKEIVQLKKKNVNDILEVIVDCVSTGRKKCKKVAFALLNNLPTYINNNATYVQQSLISFIPLNKKEITAAEILVLGRGILELNQEEGLSNEVRSRLFQFFDLLKNEQRSIVRAAFQILNLWIRSTSKEELYHSVYNIVISLNTLSENHKKAFRREVKIILTKLVRKFGYEMISKFLPEAYQKVLRNIRKLEARKARSRDNEGGDEDESEIGSTVTHKSTKSMEDILLDDSDDDNSEDEVKTQASSRKSRKNRFETFIEERGDEEEIVDLMAPDISKKIHSTNPIKTQRPKKKEEFPMTKDGKIIIDFKESRGSKRKRGNDDDDDENDFDNDGMGDDEDDDRLTMTNVSKVSKTSKSSKVSKTSKVPEGKVNYKPGGKGIHRPIKKRKVGIKGVKTGEEFAAKKAGGDIKRKDGPDPFAYVPLNGALLNRRKKNKFKGYFNKLVTTKAKSGKQSK